jgi:hypothetical protein
MNERMRKTEECRPAPVERRRRRRIKGQLKGVCSADLEQSEQQEQGRKTAEREKKKWR